MSRLTLTVSLPYSILDPSSPTAVLSVCTGTSWTTRTSGSWWLVWWKSKRVITSSTSWKYWLNQMRSRKNRKDGKRDIIVGSDGADGNNGEDGPNGVGMGILSMKNEFIFSSSLRNNELVSIADSPTLSPPQEDSYGGVQHSVQTCQNECPPGPPGMFPPSSLLITVFFEVPLDRPEIRDKRFDVQSNLSISILPFAGIPRSTGRTGHSRQTRTNWTSWKSGTVEYKFFI